VKRHPPVLRAENGTQDLKNTYQAVGTFGKTLASVGGEWVKFCGETQELTTFMIEDVGGV
jgi:hypothetical protein